MFSEADSYVCLGCCWAIKRVSAWDLNVFWRGHLFARTTVVVLLLDYCYYFIFIYYLLFITMYLPHFTILYYFWTQDSFTGAVYLPVYVL